MRHSSADSFVQSQKRRFWFHSSRSRRSAQPTTYRMHKTNTPSVISKVTSRQSPLPVTRDPLPVTQDVLAQPLFFPCPSRSNTATAFLLDSTPEHIIIKRVNKDIPVICLEDDSDETDVLRPEQLNSDLSAETETSDKKKHGRKKKTVSRMNENFHAVQSKPQAHLSHLKLEFPSRRHPTCEFRTIHK